MVTLYVIEGAKKRYLGITNDLARRLEEHRTRSHSGALVGEFALIHAETCPDYSSARVREKFLKSGQGREWLARAYPRA